MGGQLLLWSIYFEEDDVLIPPLEGVLKFIAGSVVRGKPGLAGIGAVLQNYKGEVLMMFSKHTA